MNWIQRKKKLIECGWNFCRKDMEYPMWISPCGSAEFTCDIKIMSDKELKDMLYINQSEENK